MLNLSSQLLQEVSLMQSNRLSEQRGSFTVEASIIFPFIIICIVTLIYLGMLLYQQTYLQALADNAVIRGSMIWDNLNKDMYIGRVTKHTLSESGLYWRMIDGNKEDKIKKIESYIENHLNAFSLLETSDYSIKVEINDWVVHKKLKVSITNSYKIPVKQFLRMFGMGENFTITVMSEAIVDDSAELIRNSDFILEDH